MMPLLVWIVIIIITIDMIKCFIRRYDYLILKSSSYDVIKKNYKHNYNFLTGDENIIYSRHEYQSLLQQSLDSNDNIQIQRKLVNNKDHQQPQHQHQQPHLNINNNKNDINVIRTIITRQIDDCWYEIRRLVPKETLILFENELIDSISLVVLATLRRSAEEYSTSRYLIGEMLREADVNSDGKLSYSEWHRWLRNTSIDVNDNDVDDDNDIHDAHESDDDDDGNDKAHTSHSGKRYRRGRIRIDRRNITSSSSNDNDLSSSSLDDPMITSLQSVFDHALSTLTIITRITNDPHILSTSFIAGSIAAGVLDDSICKRIMSKMPPSSW